MGNVFAVALCVGSCVLVDIIVQYISLFALLVGNIFLSYAFGVQMPSFIFIERGSGNEPWD